MPEIKYYLVGLDVPAFCDQPYLRDRDEVITAQSAEEAKAIWIKNHEHWLRRDEVFYVKAKEVAPNFYAHQFDGKF